MAPAATVHPTAIIEDGARLGDGVHIWHWVHVRAGAIVGDGTSIGQGCYIGAVAIGRGCRIQNGVSLFDGVTLEDDVFLGPSCAFTNVLHPRAHVSRKHDYAPTTVRRGASIGANATIVCGVTIGAYAMIGAGAVVTRDVPPHGLMLGTPARRRGWVCRCGETLPAPSEPIERSGATVPTDPRVSTDPRDPTSRTSDPPAAGALRAQCSRCGDVYAVTARTVERIAPGPA